MESFFDQPSPFDRIDVQRMSALYRTLNLVDYAQGTALFIKGRSLRGLNVREGLRRKYLIKAKRHYDNVLETWEDPRTLTNYGYGYGGANCARFLMTELDASVDEVIGWYKRAVEANPFAIRANYYLAGEYLRRKKDMGTFCFVQPH